MRSILITGCNRGIGLGLVRSLVQLEKPPQWIFAACRKPNEALELEEIASRHKNVTIIPLDVTDFETYPNVIQKLSITLNEGLNVLVNNAGVSGKFSRISFLKAEHMLNTYEVNVVAPTMLTKACIPLLKQAASSNENASLGCDRAAVINVSSILGSISENNEGGYYTYRASKAALNAVTRSLSFDLKRHNVIVTSLHPGWVKTDMGGPNAEISVEQCSNRVLNFMNNLSKKHSGGFYNCDGSEIPW